MVGWAPKKYLFNIEVHDLRLKTYSLRLITMVIHELIHILLSILAGLIVIRIFKNKLLLIPAFLSGFLIDIDHLFDYFLYKKAFVFDFHEFVSGIFFKNAGHVYVLFHGYEYAVILAIIGALLYIYRGKAKNLAAGVCFALALSMTFHLLFDQYSYKPKWQAYFISYRIYAHFDHDKLGFK